MEIRFSSEAVEVGDLFEAIELYYERGWSDGLPVVPPTEEAVARFLDAGDLEPEQVLGVEPTKGAVITAEKAAINAVMAGCKPEYMPALVAAIDAITADEFSLHAITVSTMGAAILTVITGPMAKDLGLNANGSVFGPGYRANATIGRALRLIVMNVLGTRSGVLDKGTLGHAGKYTWCIAENADASPWLPLHTDRGLLEGSSAVSVFAGLSPIQVGEHETGRPEGILNAFVDALYAMSPGMQELVVVLCPEHVHHIEKAGWTKPQIGRYLYEAAQRPAFAWAESGRPVPGLPRDSDEIVGALKSPESVVPIVAGGEGGGWSAAIQMWSNGAKTKSVTREIRLP